MKHFFIAIITLYCGLLWSTGKKNNHFTFDANVFYGTILQHNPDIAHLITGHPSGLILSYSKKPMDSRHGKADTIILIGVFLLFTRI